MILKEKKAFCFLALKHHSRFLLPITRILEEKGMRVLYLTAPAEMPFELTLQDEGLSYNHTLDYLNPDVADTINAAYRQVRVAWKEKFLESSILRHFTLPVQDKVLRMHVDNFYLFRRMFEVEKPDLVLALHELNSWGKTLGYLSHEFRVPLVTLQEGLYYAPAAHYRFHTEYSSACLVWGEATKKILTRSGGSGDKIFVVGNTHLYSAIKRESDCSALQRTRNELDIRKGKTVVTLLMGGLGYDKGFAFPDSLLDWVRQNPQIVLICKWHPVSNKLVIEEIASRVKAIPNIRMLQQFDTYRLLAVSDVCVVFGNSTTGLEALAFGKPLVEVQLSGLDYSFARYGVAEAVSSLADLPQAVNRVFDDKVADDRLRNVDEYLRQNLSRFNGKSVDRCVDVIEKMLIANKPQEPARRVRLFDEGQLFRCSIIVSCCSSVGIAETFLGVAENTSDPLTYECVVPSSISEGKDEEFLSMLGGDVRLLRSKHGGIASLYNRAAAQSRGHYLCFVPPGWVPQNGWLEALVREMEIDPQVGVVGGMAVFPDGSVAHAGIAFDANLSPAPLYRRLPVDFPGANRARKMRAVAGCLLVRREAFLAAGGFDETYEGDWSELDFCLEIGRQGWKTIYTPESLFLSLETVQRSDHEQDRLHFFAKWVGQLWPDQETFWAEDRLDPHGLSTLYKNLLHGSNGGVENLTP